MFFVRWKSSIYNLIMFILNYNFKKGIFVSVLLIQYSFFCLANSENQYTATEEVPYEVFIRDLNTKVNKQTKEKVNLLSGDLYDDLQIHFSLGYVQSVDSFSTVDKNFSRIDDGIQLGVGIDLFSKQWVAEGLLKNFGKSVENDIKISLREFDMRLSFLQQAPMYKYKFRFSNGLGARYLKYQDLKNNTSQLQTTPIYLLGMGFIFPIESHFDFECDVQGFIPLVSDTIDRQGLSVIFRLNNMF